MMPGRITGPMPERIIAVSYTHLDVYKRQGIPSVVYGFFGMLIIVPAIRSMFPGQTIGDSLLAVILR